MYLCRDISRLNSSLVQGPSSTPPSVAAVASEAAATGDEWSWGKGSVAMLKSCIEKLKVDV
jgi:hypothetical protein